MSDYKPTAYEKSLIKKWNEFTEKYCITIVTLARLNGYTNSTKINEFLQGKSGISSSTIGMIERSIEDVIRNKTRIS